MPMPCRVIMDDLNFIRSELADSGRSEEAMNLDSVIEAVNRAGHMDQSWDGCVRAARTVLSSGHVHVGEDVLELVDAALSRPKQR